MKPYEVQRFQRFTSFHPTEVVATLTSFSIRSYKFAPFGPTFDASSNPRWSQTGPETVWSKHLVRVQSLQQPRLIGD